MIPAYSFALCILRLPSTQVTVYCLNGKDLHKEITENADVCFSIQENLQQMENGWPVSVVNAKSQT